MLTRPAALFTVLAALFATSTARACPWEDEPSLARARGNRVVIDGRVYPVGGPAARKAFTDLLESCGEDDAAAAFDAWRRHRVQATVGYVLAPVPVFGIWGLTRSYKANQDRQVLVSSLLLEGGVALLDE